MRCKTCSADMIEYVGFNSQAGDEANPWDCPNECLAFEDDTRPIANAVSELYKRLYPKPTTSSPYTRHTLPLPAPADDDDTIPCTGTGYSVKGAVTICMTCGALDSYYGGLLQGCSGVIEA